MQTLRRRVLRPTEGIFLFHPRVMQRLVRGDRRRQRSPQDVPALSHYLMARAQFLNGLEAENPDALAVIEGLNLPEWVILLPTPSAAELATIKAELVLRRYWGKRFTAEVARAWQVSRDDNQDQGEFGAAGLAACIGAAAFREVRTLLEQDQHIVRGLDDDALCREFVGFVTYLRYFIPGVRAYYFPALVDWGALDAWCKEGGADLPPPRHGQRWPQLLVRSRPVGLHLAPDYEPELPAQLPFGHYDPDLTAGANTILPLASQVSSKVRFSPQPLIQTAGLDTAYCAQIEDACMEALHHTLRRHKNLVTRCQQGLAALCGRGMDSLQRYVPRTWHIGLRLHLFRYRVQSAFHAEMAGKYGTALRQVSAALAEYQQLKVAPLELHDAVAQRLRTWQRELAFALLEQIAVSWRLPPTKARVLEILLQRLLNAADVAQFSSLPSRLLNDLERIAGEGRTDYYRLQPLIWLRSAGRRPLRLGMPLQGTLKALRSLNHAQLRLQRLPWSGAEVAYFSAPLQALGQVIRQRLHPPLWAQLGKLLDSVGFQTSDHQQRIARNLLQQELCDIIQQRCHLRFTDVRDAVARNALRLPDYTLRDLWRGDRLAQFNRQARNVLPGVYQPGEFYLKGLQQASAPLFGSRPGRLVTRWLLLPFGIAFVSLEALHYLMSLAGSTMLVVSAPSVLGVGTALLLALYTKLGRAAVTALWRGIKATAGIIPRAWQRLQHWRRMSSWLRHTAVRKTSRYVLEPLLIGLALALPLILLGAQLLPEIVGLPTFLGSIGFICGSVLRNSRAGREVLDSAVTRLLSMWQQLHHTLALGVLRWVMDLFDALMHSVEQGLHRVDEIVSHQYGERRSVTWIKALLNPLWGVLSSIIHFYTTVLIEPQINPVKHFPVVTVSHKLMLPFLPQLSAALLLFFQPLLPQIISLPLVTMTILLLPGLFGFLAWELRENWKLYAANHPRALQPARFGPAGETLDALLRPGFHSGALPKAFAALRSVIIAESASQESIPQALRHAEARLQQILRTVQSFVERELVFALAERSRAMHQEAQVKALEVEAATASLTLRLALSRHGKGTDDPLILTLRLALVAEALCAEVVMAGGMQVAADYAWIEEEVKRFLQRAAVYQIIWISAEDKSAL